MITKYSKQYVRKTFKEIKRVRIYVSIYFRRSMLHYQEAFFQFSKVHPILLTRNSENSFHDGGQRNLFLVVSIFWLKLKKLYVHHFLNHGVWLILRNNIHCIIQTETCKRHLIQEFMKLGL